MRLRILATTDLHLNVMPYDYFAGKPMTRGGLARTATLIKTLREIDGTCLLFDNGDFLQGNPLSDWVAKESGFGPGDLHPMIAAMNAMGYDGGTLGNHDFNYGLKFLKNAITKANFPIVSANMAIALGDSPSQDSTLQPAWSILPRKVVTGNGETHELQVGIIGFAPPQTSVWEQFDPEYRISARDIVRAAKAHVPRLRAAGADIVIALAHTGIGASVYEDGMENAAVPLASVPGIDAIVAGHTHQVFPGREIAPSKDVDPVLGTLHKVPTVMPGSFGSHVGVIDLVMDKSDSGWSIAAQSASTHAIPFWPQNDVDRIVTESVRSAHERVVALLDEPVGTTEDGLHSYFSLVGHAPASAVLADAIRFTSESKLAGTIWEGHPLAVAVAPSRSGGQAGPQNYVDIPPGIMSKRHAAELYHYPNTLCILEMTGKEVKNWLEWAARLFLHITPGQADQNLIDPRIAGYNFDTAFGLSYEIDPSEKSATEKDPEGGNRIKKLCLLDGTPLREDTKVMLATNNYRAFGGGGYPSGAPAKVAIQSSKSLRDVALTFFGANAQRVYRSSTWTFSALKGTSALFECSADALKYIETYPNGTLEDAGPGSKGFHRFRLRF